ANYHIRYRILRPENGRALQPNPKASRNRPACRHSWVMTETIIEERTAAKNDQWRERIAEQERSGLSVKQICKERVLTECSFYAWRKRLRKKDPVRFALVERS